jgi:3-hydroxyisobutyrate dehydrogenase
MGAPMATKLLQAGNDVRGHDLAAQACQELSAAGGMTFTRPADAAEGAAVAITMLPNGKIVREVLLGESGIAAVLTPGSLVIDMSSSEPTGTVKLGEDLAAKGLRLVDAPVSGGVRRAVEGTLTIMAGGDPTDILRATPLLEAMGNTVIATGPLGSGHAAKALNNYVSAAGLAAACEAVLIAQRFGIDPATLVDVLNVSTGRNNATDVKLKPFVLSGTFASGFAMALMAKDLGIAADLADAMGIGRAGTRQAAELWTAAATALGSGADHTEIYRFIEAAN